MITLETVQLALDVEFYRNMQNYPEKSYASGFEICGHNMYAGGTLQAGLLKWIDPRNKFMNSELFHFFEEL